MATTRWVSASLRCMYGFRLSPKGFCGPSWRQIRPAVQVKKWSRKCFWRHNSGCSKPNVYKEVGIDTFPAGRGIVVCSVEGRLSPGPAVLLVLDRGPVTNLNSLSYPGQSSPLAVHRPHPGRALSQRTCRRLQISQPVRPSVSLPVRACSIREWKIKKLISPPAERRNRGGSGATVVPSMV